MSALDWVRSKAVERETRFLDVPADSNDEGTKPGKWKMTRWHFRGTLPTKMAAQIRNETTKLVKVESGDIQTNEFLRIGGQYRSDYAKCEFSKTVYEYVGA